MINSIGIRKETKDMTQRRAPLSPDHVRELIRRYHITVFVEPWSRRVFRDRDYEKAGGILSPDISKSNIIFGIKEIDPSLLQDRQTYCFFSHTIKGQSTNMPMLKHIIQHDITLFDYELAKGEDEKRIIFFGDFAGYAGMLDSLWALGRRLHWEGINNPFHLIKYATEYERLADAESDIREVSEYIRKKGLPKRIVPFICAFTGYGRVSTAAQEVFDLLPTADVSPETLHQFIRSGRFSDRVLYKVKFQKPDMFRHRNAGKRFDVDHFHRHPKLYINRFEQFVPYLSMIMNGIYWEPRFPRLLTKRFMKTLYKNTRRHQLRVIGDITCDIGGSIELTVKGTNSTNPVYVYEPLSGKVRDGWKGEGPVVLAVDKLPTELPREASESFGNALMPFVPDLAAANFSRPVAGLRIPDEFKKAMIVQRGQLLPAFAHLRRFLD